jgi:hypothetical protein
MLVRADVLGELGSLRHLLPEHELRGLKGRVFPVVQEFKAVVDERLVEEHAPPTQEVPAVADNLYASLGIVAVQPIQNLVVYSSHQLVVGMAS